MPPKPVGISALHSHDETGIVHIEAPTRCATYTLGQFLTEWGVLNGTDKTPGSAQSSPDGWTVTVNGKKHDGAISTVVLRPHEERSSSPTARHRSRCLRRTHSLRASRPEVAEIRRAFGFRPDPAEFTVPTGGVLGTPPASRNRPGRYCHPG